MSKSKKERKELVRRESQLSIVRQCELLDVHRSGVYYRARGETALNLELMRTIDKKNLLHPWLGVPRITTWLRKDKGYDINKKRVERLFRLMGLSATGPNPNTSKRGKGELHRIYRYLLRNLKVERPGQVWAMDVTYIPVRGGYLYLCAIIDLYSRYVVGWSLSNTMTSEWCKRTLDTAIGEHGAPEILNTDQGSQFTSREFTQYVPRKKRSASVWTGRAGAWTTYSSNGSGAASSTSTSTFSRPTTGCNVLGGWKNISNITTTSDGTKVLTTRRLRQFMNGTKEERRDGNKGKNRVINKNGGL
jgi:putative transposase